MTPPRLTKAQVEEMRERADNATPGEWHRGGDRVYANGEVVMHQPGPLFAGKLCHDAIFAAACRQDVPLLIAKVLEMEEALRKLMEYHGSPFTVSGDYCSCSACLGARSARLDDK